MEEQQKSRAFVNIYKDVKRNARHISNEDYPTRESAISGITPLDKDFYIETVEIIRNA